ncbi:MAG: magnesium chelatase ATPase subunit D [Anaerolineales bacterium]
MSNAHLPFPALVGLEGAQQALLLLAIDPGLRGVILAAPAGTGKSALARGLRAVLGADVPFVEIPSSIDAENLLGGLDLESTLQTGRVVTQRGALARADGGFAVVDGVNLLTDASTNLLLAALDGGFVRLEREGLSEMHPARFSLIGAYDPAEGAPRGHLLDRIGLITRLPGQRSPEQRAQIVRRNIRAGDWAEDVDFLRGLVLTAREHLPQVTISDALVEQLSVTALAYGVEGHRADAFAVRAACAAAAYDLRDEVHAEDCQLAAQLVILPRATRIPAPPAEDENPAPPDDQRDDADNQQAPEQNDTDDDGQNALPEKLIPPPEEILEALETQLPAELDELPFLHQRRGRSGSRGSTAGKRGRHVRSVPDDPRRGRIDVVATLRTAAPWQPLRNPARDHLALTLSDVRVKQYRSKAGALFCFAVDASGSMALHRMRQAKGAVHNLLGKAYVNRDRVALIAFRGERAEVLMPPTQSVELAKRALDLLPTGGGTPLASALIMANDMAAQARGRGIMQTVLILLTDGRANIPLKEGNDPREELQRLGVGLADSGLHILVVDTKRNYLSRGEARQLADWLGADYAYLPNASGEDIAALAENARDG